MRQGKPEAVGVTDAIVVVADVGRERACAWARSPAGSERFNLFEPIGNILEELRQGRMIVLVDDEGRENEGDLVCAAQHVTPSVVNFMLREGRGMLCVALAGEKCDRLDLQPQSRVSTGPRSTAYTITVDAVPELGISTGVSATDRATTIARLADPDAQASDFDRPGHMQPLRARQGGTLVRAGQTEGSVDLCRLAGLEPAAAIIEVMNDDGTMARRPDLEALCKKHQIKMCSVADVIEYRMAGEKLIRRAATAPLTNELGEFNLIAYESVVDPLLHVALTMGNVGKLDANDQPIEIEHPVLVRMHSQNLLGDVFGDLQHPSGPTLRAAMQMIRKRGEGALVYLRHEKMGTGLLRQLQTLTLASLDSASPERFTPARSQTTPGLQPPKDKRDYGIGSQILRDLGIRDLQLITNHPFHLTALSGFGLNITEFVPLDMSPTQANTEVDS